MGGVVSGYVHRPYNTNTGPIGALVALKTSNKKTDEDTVWLKKLAQKISMHIIASKPSYLNKDKIPQNILETERKELLKITKAKFKQNLAFLNDKLDKIVESRLKRFYERNCLLEQKFIFDEKNKESVGEAIRRIEGEKGCSLGVEVVDFKLY